MPPILDKTHLRAWNRCARPFDLSRLCSRIASAVHKYHGHSQFTQSPAIEIFIRPYTLGRKSQPDSAIPLHYVLPLLCTMIHHQQCLKLFIDIFGMVGKSLKEASRTGLSPVEVEGLQNQALATLGRSHPDHGGNDCSIAVPPKHRALDSQRVQHKKGFFRCQAMKVCRHLLRKTC